MATKRQVEVFSVGCSCCEKAISCIKDIACPDCEVIVLDMADNGIAQRARKLGVRSVPAVAIDGKLASCCAGRGFDKDVLRQEGLGQALS